MSVSVIVSNPATLEQQLINIPVATESVFNSLWQTACDALNLQLVPLFSLGIDVGTDELNDLLDELERLKMWAENYRPQTDEVTQMQERVTRLINELPILVTPTSGVFIG